MHLIQEYIKGFFVTLWDKSKACWIRMYRDFFVIMSVILCAMIPMIRANFYYCDDMGRAAEGYTEFKVFSRYIAEVLSVLIHADTYLTDISPLPQVLAAIILAVACVIVVYAFRPSDKISWWNLAAVIPLALSPYFLECLSYKYDAPYMALSVLASVLPILFIDKKLCYSIVTVICMIVMCTTYQAASGIFPMLIVFYAFSRWNTGECLKKVFLEIIGISLLSYMAGILLFKFILMKPVSLSFYTSNEMFPIADLLPGIIGNLKKDYTQVFVDLKPGWMVLIGIIIVLYIIMNVLDSKKKKSLSLIGSIMAISITILLIFGLYPTLIKVVLYPRTMYGVGAFIAFIGVSIPKEGIKAYLPNLACFALSWCFVSFACTYGNALSEQKRYTDFRVQMVLNELDSIEELDLLDGTMIQIKGDIGKAPTISNMPQNYQILNRLVPNTFGQESCWTKYYFYHYFNLDDYWLELQTLDLDSMDLPIVKDGKYQTIRSDGTYVLIDLKSFPAWRE